MPGFDRDEFWLKVLSYYQTARENNYLVKLNEEQTKELKALYIEQYIPTEKLSHYDDEKLIKKMMTAIVSIYKLDKDIASNYGEVVELVNSVDYDGKCLYLHYEKISEVKLRRFQLGRSQKQVAEKMGCSVSTVKNCEEFFCDLDRQPPELVARLAKALECEPEDLK